MKPRRKKGKTYRAVTVSEGGMPLPEELVRDMGLNIGDEFALWKEGDTFMLAFSKHYRGKRKIPKSAIWGRLQPDLAGVATAVPLPAKAAKVKKQKVEIRALTPEYVRREHGVTAKELAAFKRRMDREIAAERKAGTVLKYTGTLRPKARRRK